MKQRVRAIFYSRNSDNHAKDCWKKYKRVNYLKKKKSTWHEKETSEGVKFENAE